MFETITQVSISATCAKVCIIAPVQLAKELKDMGKFCVQPDWNISRILTLLFVKLERVSSSVDEVTQIQLSAPIPAIGH